MNFLGPRPLSSESEHPDARLRRAMKTLGRCCFFLLLFLCDPSGALSGPFSISICLSLYLPVSPSFSLSFTLLSSFLVRQHMTKLMISIKTFFLASSANVAFTDHGEGVGRITRRSVAVDVHTTAATTAATTVTAASEPQRSVRRTEHSSVK